MNGRLAVAALAGTVALAGAAMFATAAWAVRTAPDERWWSPGDGRPFPERLDYRNDTGVLRVLLDGGVLDTRRHPFFRANSPNGRGCITCHQPADAMGLSLASVRERWETTRGRDPLFAVFDGANCPDQPQGRRESHSLLLDHGLFRIQRPWPPKDPLSGATIQPDFRIAVVRDPTGCNSGPVHGLSAAEPSVSVYRRPRPVANLKYLEAVGFPYDPKQGQALPVDPATGAMLSGNLMADGRAPTLSLQALDAAATHLQFAKPLPRRDLERILEFTRRVYAAQWLDFEAGALDTDGALGGPVLLRDSKPGRLGSIGRAVFSEFEAWEKLPAVAPLTPEQRAFRESVARGARVFRERTFLITDTAGVNSPIGFGNPVRNSCALCHNMSQMGNDVAPGQVDLGTTNQPFADPATHLPLFRVTCLGEPHPHYGRTILTHDPGFALTTGRCADVGKITLQSMRGLAARAPYFANGSAKDLRAVVDYYERRYRIGYTEQEKRDLVNLMRAL